MSQTLYLLRGFADGFSITKFDDDYNPYDTYGLSANGKECSCPAGSKPTCRHRKMLPLFQKHNHIGDGWFLVWETRQWARPINPANEPEAIPTIIPTEDKLVEALAPAFECESSHRAMPAEAPAPIQVKRRKV